MDDKVYVVVRQFSQGMDFSDSHTVAAAMSLEVANAYVNSRDEPDYDLESGLVGSEGFAYRSFAQPESASYVEYFVEAIPLI